MGWLHASAAGAGRHMAVTDRRAGRADRTDQAGCRTGPPQTTAAAGSRRQPPIAAVEAVAADQRRAVRLQGVAWHNATENSASEPTAPSIF